MLILRLLLYKVFIIKGNENYSYHHGIIPHTKVIIVTDNPALDINDNTVIYFGSHNFTPSGKYN